MATLYKRYIPPKATDAQIAPPAVPASISHPALATNGSDVSQKRKRERTDEEVAERKAKKLRKKGIDPATVESGLSTHDASRSDRQKDENAVAEHAIQDSIPKPQGDFAHVKNNKKRHKLEKEARRARKAAIHDTVAGVALEDLEQGDSLTEKPRSEAGVSQSTAPDNPEDLSMAGKRRSKQARVDYSQHSAVEPARAISSDESETLQKRRKKHKSQKHDSGVEDAGTRSLEQNGTDEAASKPKKRRHKLEAILNEERSVPEPSEESDEHLKRHAGVMNRFSKSKDASKAAPLPSTQNEQPEHPPPVVLDLAPLPQPEKAASPDFIPDTSSVPKWLAEPTLVSSTASSRFADLHLNPKIVQHLSLLGFTEAMPVQQTLIPLLLPPGTNGAKFLPGSESALPDLAVGAPTGSGKTIAYLLPMIESLKTAARDGKLKALVVVPTRELVMQVAAVADSLARGSRVTIGMATGTGSFKDEQTRLILTGRRYDPKGYRGLMAKISHRNYPPAEGSEGFEEYLCEVESEDIKEAKRLEDASALLVDHVPAFDSAVDILVATPGRLLEHLDKTLGFSLGHLNWLIFDEADKLVDQQYDGFLEAVNKALSQPREREDLDVQQVLLRRRVSGAEYQDQLVRKVVLSATMTTDISKLLDLKLKRPRMIIVQSGADGQHAVAGAAPDQALGVQTAELPPSLIEYCVHVGNGTDKPLYIVELLQKVLSGSSTPYISRFDRKVKQNGVSEISDSSSSDDGSSSSDRESSSDESSEVENEGTETLQNAQSNGQIHKGTRGATSATIHPERAALLDRFSIGYRVASTPPVILVFVSSTESANRLAHLLRTLRPDWAPHVHTMTRADSGKALALPQQSCDPTIAISTDRAARGLDSIANRPITHVIQYDVPRAANGYVHRVGRTARAGRRGEAWTLYTHSEARWFYKSICRIPSINRAAAVEKVKIVIEGEDRREELARALASMRDEVYGTEERRAKKKSNKKKESA